MIKHLSEVPAALQHSCPTCYALALQECVTKTGKPAGEMHKARHTQLCGERFIKQHLIDPEQDRRITCADRKGHKGQHRNQSYDLRWSQGVQVDLEGALR